MQSHHRQVHLRRALRVVLATRHDQVPLIHDRRHQDFQPDRVHTESLLDPTRRLKERIVRCQVPAQLIEKRVDRRVKVNVMHRKILFRIQFKFEEVMHMFLVIWLVVWVLSDTPPIWQDKSITNWGC